MHTLLNTCLNATGKDKPYLILIQEPWWGDIAGSNCGSVSYRGWNTIIPKTVIANNETPRVIAYHRTRADITVTLRSDISQDLDCMYLEITQPSFNPIIIANIYNQKSPTNDNNWTLDRLKNHRLPLGPTILCGDWNAHHFLWEPDRPESQNPTRRDIDLAEWLYEHDFSLNNTPGVPTHAATVRTANGVRTSLTTIDLTFSNLHANAIDLVKKFHIDDKVSGSSDHFAQRFHIDQGCVPIANLIPERYNWGAADLDDYVRKLSSCLVESAEYFTALRLNQNPTVDEIDTCAEILERCFVATAEEVVPKYRPSAHAKEWWSDQLTQKVNEVVDAARLTRDRSITDPEIQLILVTEHTRRKNLLRREQKRAKKEWIETITSEATHRNIWHLNKWCAGTRTYPSPPMSQGPGLPPAIKHKDKCYVLRQGLFPPPPEIPNVAEPDLITPISNEYEWPPLKYHELKKAIFSSRSKSAPGPDGIPFLILKLAWGAAASEMYAVAQACVKTGYHPRIYRSSISVALAKPGKPIYSIPKAYRFIQLLRTFGKAIEKIIAARLTHLCLKYDIIPKSQFGSMTSRSTTDAALIVKHDIQNAADLGLVSSSLSFDIKGFFNNISHKVLLNTMQECRLPLPLIKCTQHFLSDRHTAVLLDGIKDEMKPIKTGVPQGSPVSPPLSGILTAPLIKDFERQAKIENERRYLQRNYKKIPTPCLLIIYVDDGFLLTSSPSHTTNSHTLAQAYSKCDTWGASVGIAFDEGDKRELMHYTYRKRIPFDSLPSVTLTNRDGTQATVLPQEIIRWLGVFFDRNLNFKNHINRLACKANKTLQGLKLLANSVRGMKQHNLRILYMACCRSILTYASPVWWNSSKTLIRPLILTQNKALRWVSGAFRTTPVRALEIITSTPPLQLILDHINRQTAIRLSKLPENHLILHRLDTGWLPREVERVDPPNKIRQLVSEAYRDPTIRQRDYSTLYEIAKFNSPLNERCNPLTVPPWKRAHTDPDLRNRISISPYDGHATKATLRDLHKQVIDLWETDADHLVCYTDASHWSDPGKNLMGAGIGITIFHKSTRIHSISQKIKNRVELWDLELEAIEIAVRTAIEITSRIEPNPPKNIHIFSDNTSAIEVALEGHARAGQKTCISIRNHIFNFIDIHPEHSVSIQYCPAHEDIRGHDLADKLAKRASSHRRSIIGPKTLTYIRRESKAKITDDWIENWSTHEPRGFFAPADRIPPSTKPSKILLNTTRPIFSRLTQVLTGHAFTGEYYDRFVPDEIKACPCGERLQTREHILLECPNYADFHHLFVTERGDALTLPEILGSTQGIEKLIVFLEHTNAFTKQNNPFG